MLSIEQARKIQPELKYLADEDVFEVIQDMYGLGGLAFEKWVILHGSNYPTRYIAESHRRAKI